MRAVAKSALRALSSFVTSPFWVWTWLMQLISPELGRRGFMTGGQLLSLMPGLVGSYMRVAYYARCLERVGPAVHIEFGSVISHPKAEIGRNVYIGSFCNLGWVVVGDDVLMGSGVHVLSGKHQHDFTRTDRSIREQGGSFSVVKVGEDCWLGNGSVVLADVASHSVVAAGAVVSRTFAPGAILAGNPAREVKNRFGGSEALPERENS